MADFVGDLPANGLRVVNLDGVAVGHPPLDVGDGADGRAGNVVAVAAGGAHWDRVAVLLGHPVAPGAATVLVLLLLLLLLLPPLLLVPEGGGPLASVAAVALSDVRGGALLLVSNVVGFLTHLGEIKHKWVILPPVTPFMLMTKNMGIPHVRVHHGSAQRARSRHARRTPAQS